MPPASRRDYLLRLKQAFDAHGIEIAFAQVRVHGLEPKSKPEPQPAAGH